MVPSRAVINPEPSMWLWQKPGRERRVEEVGWRRERGQEAGLTKGMERDVPQYKAQHFAEI